MQTVIRKLSVAAYSQKGKYIIKQRLGVGRASRPFPDVKAGITRYLNIAYRKTCRKGQAFCILTGLFHIQFTCDNAEGFKLGPD